MTALPPGFELDAPASGAGLPPGFELDAKPQGSAITAFTGGFVEGIPIAGPLIKEGAQRAAALGRSFATGNLYADELRQVQGFDKASREQNPWTATGGEIVGGVAGTIPMVAAAPAAFGVGAGSLMARTAASGASGAALGGLDAAARSGGDLEATRTGALVGGLLGTAAPPVGAAIGKTFGALRSAAPGVAPEARIAAADEFAIPLTAGQASGNVGQQAFEEAARHSARGGPAAARLQAFDAAQQEAIGNARQGLARELGGEAVPVPAMGEGVQDALRSRAANLKNSADLAYAVAGSKGAYVGLDEVGNLARRVADDLAEKGIVIDPRYGSQFGGATSAMNILNRVSGAAGAPQGAVAVSLEGIDAARKGLNAVKPTNAEDGRALAAIRKSFDGWLDDAIDQKLFSGDPSAIADLKAARSLWSQYKGLTSAKPGEPVPRLIVKMQEEGITGEQVANWLLGTAGADQAGRSAAVAGRLKAVLGKDSPEWEALRQSAFTKMMEPARGNGGPQAVSKSMMEFLDGQGAPLAKQLFSPDEIGKMRRLAMVIRSTVPDPKATNPSKSGYEVMRALGSNGAATAAAGVGALGTAYTTGDPKYLAIAALPLLRNVRSLSKGVAATRPEPISQAGGYATRVPLGLVGQGVTAVLEPGG